MITRRISNRAFTLIELLIVVAIIALFAGSSMMAITGPMFERVRAEDDEAFETGAGVFFATLAADAHRAQFISADTSQSLTLTMASPTTGTIVYAVNEERILTRTLEDMPPVSLIPGVQEIIVEQSPGEPLWSVAIISNIRGYDGKPTTVSRHMEVLPGAAWAGGA